MNNRIAAIIYNDKACLDNVKNTVNVFLTSGLFDKVTVYSNEDVSCFDGIQGLVMEKYDPSLDTEPKIRNWINKVNCDYTGFLHVLKDDTQITNNPAIFINDIEKMMTVLDYSVWLSTVTDGCNYVYSKYNPRITMGMNHKPVTDAFGITTDICVTSHSNTYWMIYDFSKLKDSDLLRFDDRYTISMFYIIEFLSRRRNTKASSDLYFMNQYFTVGTEQGVFKQYDAATKTADDPKVLQEEDKIFKDSGIDYAADANIDVLLESFWEKLALKLGIPKII